MVKPILPKDTYDLTVVNAEQAARVYDNLRNFWFTRYNNSITEEYTAQLLEAYRVGLYEDRMAPVRELVRFLFDNRREDRPFSLIDLGCANGGLYNFVKHDVSGGERVSYVGLEPWPVFCQDFRLHFPEAMILNADAEAFVDADMGAFAELPVTAFVSLYTLSMMHPDTVRGVIRKAAAVSESLLIYDYCLNMHGDISATDIVVFKYLEETGQIYFAHNFGEYLRDASMVIAAFQEIPIQAPGPNRVRGHGVFLAVHNRAGIVDRKKHIFVYIPKRTP